MSPETFICSVCGQDSLMKRVPPAHRLQTTTTLFKWVNALILVRSSLGPNECDADFQQPCTYVWCVSNYAPSNQQDSFTKLPPESKKEEFYTWSPAAGNQQTKTITNVEMSEGELEKHYYSCQQCVAAVIFFLVTYKLQIHSDEEFLIRESW